MHVVRKAILIGGGSDTIVYITGGIAEVFCSGVSKDICFELKK